MIKMGLIKTIIISSVVAFIIAAMLIYFPDETREILKVIYRLGIMLLKLIWDVIKKLAVAIIKFLNGSK